MWWARVSGGCAARGPGRLGCAPPPAALAFGQRDGRRVECRLAPPSARAHAQLVGAGAATAQAVPAHGRAPPARRAWCLPSFLAQEREEPASSLGG